VSYIETELTGIRLISGKNINDKDAVISYYAITADKRGWVCRDGQNMLRPAAPLTNLQAGIEYFRNR
jgi:hypothetical protein